MHRFLIGLIISTMVVLVACTPEQENNVQQPYSAAPVLVKAEHPSAKAMPN
jgi:hypothetical protein